MLEKRAIFSVVAAIGVHGLVFVSWVSVIAMDLAVFTPPESKNSPRPEPDVVVVLKPMISKPPPPPVRLPQQQVEPVIPDPPKRPKSLDQVIKPPPDLQPPSPLAKRKTLPEQKRRFARTSSDQEAKPDAPTDLKGERDTRAASDSAPVLGADPNKPSQEGKDPLYAKHLETVERDFTDGSLGGDKTGADTERPQEATARKDNTLVDDAPRVESLKPDTKESARPKDKHIDLGEVLPSIADGTGIKQIEEKLKAEEAPKEKPNRGAMRDGGGDVVDQDPKKDGFSGFSRKTRVTGSISRRGKSALNVKNSPLGRYQALISKSVELQWRRNCDQHRDHIVPGVMSIRFYVDKQGNVSGIKFQEVIEGSYITRGFTQRAIRQAKIPKMPKAVLKELEGDPLELIYNFYF
jgi:hypothetical protein